MKEKENLTKEYIYGAFLQLLEKNHYDDISVCEICTKAGVSRMSFYRNFESKEDLTFKGIDHIVKKMTCNIEKLEVINKYTVIKEMFETAKKYKFALLAFEDSQISKILKDMVVCDLQTKSPVDYMNKSSRYIPVFYFSSIISVLYEWLKSGANEPVDEMAKLLSKLINIEPYEKSTCENNIAED